MKKITLVIIALLVAFAVKSQTIFTSGIYEQDSLFSSAPCSSCSHWAYSRDSVALFRYDVTASEWVYHLMIVGSGAPTGVPGNNPKLYQDTSTGELYRFNGSAWVNTNTGATTSSCQLSLDTPYVNLIRIRGQSNSRGRAFNSSLQSGEAGPYSKILIWDLTQSPDSFEPMEIGVNNFPGANGNGDTLHGPELGLALELSAQCPNDTFYILKTGIGGTEIARHLPGGTEDVYVQDSTYTVSAINALIGAGKVPVVRDYWIQGESDSGGETAAYNHYDSMLVMIQNARRLLGKDLPFIIGEIRRAGNSNRDIINGNFNYISKTIEGIGVIRSRLYTGLSEFDSHFDYAGLKQQASQIVEQMKVLPGTIVADSLPIALQAPQASAADSAFYDFESYSVPTTDDATFQECRGAHEILSYQSSNRIRFDGTSTAGSCACCDAQASTRSLLRFTAADSTLTDDQYVQADVLTSDGASTAGLTMALRYNSNGSGTGYSGYVFWLHPANDQVIIGRVDAGTFTQLTSAAFTVASDTEYLFRFTSSGTSLTVENSTNGGTSWTTVASTTDATYSTGGLAIGAGIGASSVNTHYFDNIKISW